MLTMNGKLFTWSFSLRLLYHWVLLAGGVVGVQCADALNLVVDVIHVLLGADGEVVAVPVGSRADAVGARQELARQLQLPQVRREHTQVVEAHRRLHTVRAVHLP